MKRFVPLVMALGLLATACSGSDGIEAQDYWGRPSPKVATNGAFYVPLENSGDADTLVGATSDACGTVELHQTVMTDGVMAMQEVEGGIAIPADGSVIMEPGGLHVMCIDKTVDFVDGTKIELTLDFANADSQTLEIEIREE